MKLSALSLGLWLGWHIGTDQAVLDVLKSYITWTTTGRSELILFDERTRLVYPGATGDKHALFQDYRDKIEGAAGSIAREMKVRNVSLQGDMAKAEVTDCSDEHTFSVVHQLTLRRIEDVWRIQSIRIESVQQNESTISSEWPKAINP